MRTSLVALGLFFGLVTAALAQGSRYDELATLPFTEGYLSKDGLATLERELRFQRAV